MKGAITEPLARINKPPSATIITINGASHNFFLIIKKEKSSFRKSILGH